MYYLTLFYNEVFYRPLLNTLIFLTGILPGNDLGLAVILLTVLVKIITFPLTHKMIRTQNVMKKIEPDIKKIYAEKPNKEEQAKAVMELYKAHGVNPFSGFLFLLIQFPLLLALYHVFWKGLVFNDGIYAFISVPQNINTVFLDFVSLIEPSIGMAFFATASQFLQTYLAMSATQKPNDSAVATQKYILYILPIFIFFIAFKLPAAVPLYWTAMNIFAIIHEAILRRKALSLQDGRK